MQPIDLSDLESGNKYMMTKTNDAAYEIVTYVGEGMGGSLRIRVGNEIRKISPVLYKFFRVTRPPGNEPRRRRQTRNRKTRRNNRK
jgi:hypothetical protein